MGEGVGLPKTELPKTKLPKTEKSNILIIFIKLGLIGITIVAAYFIYSSISDNNNQELNCSDPNQDGSNRIYVCPQGKTLKLPPDGNLCAGDTCTDTDCCVDIPSVDSSSVRICQRPSTSVLNNYNMTNVQENDLHMDSFDVTGITCNDDYPGTAVATVCTRPGGHYNVSGCGSIPTGDCIRPTNPAYNFTQARETLTMDTHFEVTGITCNPGYGPGGDSIVASVCDSDNTAYTLTGCSDIDGCDGVNCGPNATCTDNTAPQTGYTCSCDTGYTGGNVVNDPANCTQDVREIGGINYIRYRGRACGLRMTHLIPGGHMDHSNVEEAGNACGNLDTCAGFNIHLELNYSLLSDVTQDYEDGHPQADCYEKIE
jgi:hypothetical protein